MRAASAWARLDLRRRWRSLVVVGLLVALGAGAVMAAFAGARRGDSAVSRLASQGLAADAFVTPNDPDWDWSAYRRLPYVEALTEVAIFDTLAPEDPDIPPDVVAYPALDEQFGTTLERPVVVEGRWYDPAASDEVVVTPKLARTFHLHVGDDLPMVLGGPEQVYQDPLPPGRLTGPHLDMRIVGIARTPWLVDTPGRDGQLMVSPALAAAYPDNVLGRPDAQDDQRAPVNAMVRLEHGAADIPRLIDDIERIDGRSDVTVLDLGLRRDDAARTTRFESRFLLAIGAAALLAAVLLVGQAVGRHVAGQVPDLPAARAIGMTPGSLVAGAVLSVGSAGAAGALLGAVAAVVSSRWTPIGFASDYEPDPGVRPDLLVLVAGAVTALAVVVLAAAGTAAVALRGGERRTDRHSRLATATSVLPLPVATGVRFALEGGTGTRRIPVWPALAGAVAGVLGGVAVVTFTAGLDDALADPARFGQTSQVETSTGLNGTDFVDPEEFDRMVTGLRQVEAASDARTASASQGRTSTTLLEYQDDSQVEPTVLEGRMPSAADEVLLGPTALRSLDADVGDVVRLTGSRGTQELTVVGVGLVPQGFNSQYDDSGWVTTAGFDSLFRQFEFRLWMLRTSAGVDGDEIQAEWDAAFPDLAPPQGPEFTDPDLARTYAQADNIRDLPTALAAFLGLLAVGVVGHALVTAVRRRSVELGIARSLGATPGQTRLIVLTQAVVVTGVGIVAGIPLGLAVGRVSWRTVADLTPVAYAAPPATAGIVLVGAAALCVALVLAAVPAWRAGRLPVARILRAE